ncbi:MAG: PH domain-containing protein [Anaerolineae bacterium]|nr:PH domain-containing protein [Anaerolineae bacterium]
MHSTYQQKVLGNNEKVLMYTRQHWFFLAGNIFMELVIIVVLSAALIALSAAAPVFLFGLFINVIPLVSMIRDILLWLNHVYLVTNRRVIQMMGVFNKNITDSSLEKVNDVKLEQSFLGRVFNYGTVEILTASELGMNRFYNIHNPIAFKTCMLNAKEELSTGEFANVVAQPEKEYIPRLIKDLDELRQKGVITEEEFADKKKELLSRI